MLPRGFPVFDAETGLKYSEALFIAPTNVLCSNKGTHRSMFKFITIDSINDQLGAGIQKDAVVTRCSAVLAFWNLMGPA